MNFSLVDQFPIWVGGLLFLCVLLGALEIGYRSGLRQRDKWRDAEDGGGNLVLTSILALLGLILAFTFASGISHYKERKLALISEANALGTAFLRADLVGEPGRTELKKALLNYARTRAVRIGTFYSPEEFRELAEQSSQAMAKLWPAVQQILKQETPGPMEASLVAAVNDVIDYHTIRMAAVFDKLPPIVLVLMVFITAASLAVAGFNAGITGRMSRWRMTTLALVLAGVTTVIQDFDRPLAGFIHVSHESIYSTIAEMEAHLAK